MKNNKQKGFTLIELLIVIGIIAILAAAVIVAINPGQQFAQARNSTRRSHLNSVANAVYSYSIEHGGTFPDCGTEDGLPEDDGTDNWIDLNGCSTDLDDYMSQLPTDPQGDDATPGDMYQIRLGEGGNNIQLQSTADEWQELDDSIITQ